MKKPIIGITPQYDSNNDFLRIQSNYMKAIKTAGGIPCLLPLDIDRNDLSLITNHFDGFLLPGGPDINPFLFGEETIPEGGLVLPERDKVEQIIFQAAYKANKPVLGICRGIQAINIFLGGSIYQDITAQYITNIPIGHYQKSANEVETHSINISPNSLLGKVLNKSVLRVNSFHHQAIRTLAPSLKVAASSQDSIIEAVYDPSKTFVLGVQWHPEHLYSFDENHMNIFKAFIQACL